MKGFIKISNKMAENIHVALKVLLTLLFIVGILAIIYGGTYYISNSLFSTPTISVTIAEKVVTSLEHCVTISVEKITPHIIPSLTTSIVLIVSASIFSFFACQY